MMQDLSKTTKLDPNKRVMNLRQFIQRVNSNKEVQQEMGAWGLKFASDLVEFKARIMPPEKIICNYGNTQASYKQFTADFSKEIRGQPMKAPKSLNDWIIICTKFDEGKCNDFLNNLSRVGPPMGMEIRDPRKIVIQGDRVNNYLQALRENVQNSTSIVVFIVPNNKKERYDALKKHTCLEFPIASQVIVSRTLSKKPMLMSVATKIGIQMACKLGGEPWTLDIPFRQATMIIGYDTYHDSAKKGRSAGAFVASLNKDCSRWYSRVSFHAAGGWQELCNNLRIFLMEALKKFNEVNRALPSTIIFYRDGVGDGQIRYVKEWEVKQFLSVINEMMPDKSPRYCFIVVNKKINTRFFAKDNQGGHTNPCPGTVVDSTVTRYDRYDFFLVSQSVRQGTVAPTMYNIIEDNSGLKPEILQRLSYKLTHLYYNWQGCIRVPAPCQYAHKLAFLTGQSLHQEPHNDLADTLFYL